MAMRPWFLMSSMYHIILSQSFPLLVGVWFCARDRGVDPEGRGS